MDLIETDGKTSINMLQAVNFISKAWKEVTAATIQHPFLHAGLCNGQTVETNQFDSEDNLPLNEWIKQFNISENFNEDLKTYESIDEDVATTGPLTDEQILDLVSKRKEKLKEMSEDEEDDRVDDSDSPPTIQQALDAAKRQSMTAQRKRGESHVNNTDVQDLSAKLKLMEAGGDAPVEPVVPTDHHIYCNIHVGKDALLGRTSTKKSNVYTQEKH
ncbi:hypothetical protein MSG28_001737 [Choristoneura fumiferana]|uniref:Uncharacterized protein n=1 Tax=Choristoneura fumiferana TaxID=7141 RepID=A0ACC0KVD7_CHOFU|nr:hypothetical protein MSG28_001737 [Choristoneura fumiferana]